MKAGQTLKLELGSGVTLTEDFLTAIIQNVPYGGKIELGLPQTIIVNDSILRGWFDAAPALTAINVDDGDTKYSSGDGVLYNKGKTELICCPRGKTNVVVPNSVNAISARAFFTCTSLISVTVNCDVPPSTTDVFLGFEVANVPSVYVPASAVGTYKAASGWSAYADRIFPIQ